MDNPMKIISEFLRDDMLRVSGLMEASLKSDVRLLQETNRDVLSHGGKKIRPMIALLFARASGGCKPSTYYIAAAAELIHNASLLHDDVADEASLRRGYPTVGALLGARPSVLLGDFWLVKGIDLILDAEDLGRRVMRIFSKTLSYLAEGEMLQLELAESGRTTEGDYYRVVYDKTASLFEATAKLGVISTLASEELVEAASKYARCVGIAFQIKDDILDYQDSSVTGKDSGQDLLERKITLPLIGAMINNPEREEEIRKMVCQVPEHPEYVDIIRDFVCRNGGIAYAEKKMAALLDEAVEALHPFAASKEKEYLTATAKYIASRDF